MSGEATATIFDEAFEDGQRFDVPFIAARKLQEAGITCHVEGKDGGIISLEYRVVIEPPFEVWRDESRGATIVRQLMNTTP